MESTRTRIPSLNGIRSVLLCIMLLNFAIPQNISAQNYDFRKTRWGMTMEEVKNIEIFPLVVEDKKTSNLIYDATLMRYNVAIKYHFIDNKLVSCSYHFFMNDKTQESLFSDNLEYCEAYYDEIYRFLKEKYGKSRVDFNMDGKDPEMIEFFKKLGSAGYRCKALEIWDLEKTTIQLQLGYYYDDDKPPYCLFLVYSSRSYATLIEKEEFDEL